MDKKNILTIAVIIMFAGVGIYFALNLRPLSPSVEDIKEGQVPIPGPVTISGEITCLPKKGPRAQTMDCAIGLKGLDNRHYGLKNLFQHDPEHKFSVDGLQVEVSGTFVPGEIKDLDGNIIYDVIGIIDITSIKKLRDK